MNYVKRLIQSLENIDIPFNIKHHNHSWGIEGDYLIFEHYTHEIYGKVLDQDGYTLVQAYDTTNHESVLFILDNWRKREGYE